MNKYKEFTEELDVVVQAAYEEVRLALKNCKVKVMSLEYKVILEDNVLAKYKLNKDVGFIVDINEGKMIYTYQGRKLEPKCYYLRPDDYHEVTTLQILQQCVLQDTHKPDIKFLEEGKTELIK